jgi:DICT domain-containing protein
MVYSLAEQRVVDLAELENTDPASRLQHAVCLTENLWDVGAVSDAECDSVEIDRVGLDMRRKVLGVPVSERYLGRFGLVEFSNQSLLTVVVDRLGHTLPSLVQHAFVQVHNLDLDLSVTVLLPSTIQ